MLVDEMVLEISELFDVYNTARAGVMFFHIIIIRMMSQKLIFTGVVTSSSFHQGWKDIAMGIFKVSSKVKGRRRTLYTTVVEAAVHEKYFLRLHHAVKTEWGKNDKKKNDEKMNDKKKNDTHRLLFFLPDILDPIGHNLSFF